jgi:hypothetical protein
MRNEWIKKSSPTPGDVHVDASLTNLSLGFMQSADAFVASKVFPVIPVDHQSDKYFTYDRSYWFRDEMQLRGPGAESAGAGFVVGTDSYACDVYALHKDVDDQTRGNADGAIAVDADATDFLSQQALIRLEKQWTTDFFQTGVWTTDKTPTTKWDDPSSDIVLDIETGITTIKKATGVPKSEMKMVFGYAAWEKVKHHPDIVDRIKYGQTAPSPALVTPQAVAAIFELGDILIAEAIENTAAEGATASYDFISGKNALLVHSTPTPGIRKPTGGYTFAWRGLLGANAMGARMKQFRLERNASDRYELEMAFDQKKVSADLGYFFNAVVS